VGEVRSRGARSEDAGSGTFGWRSKTKKETWGRMSRGCMYPNNNTAPDHKMNPTMQRREYMTRFWIPSGERLRSSIAEILLQSANGWSATSQRKHPTYNRGADKPTSRTRQCPRADERRHVYIVGIDYAWKPTAHKGNLPLEDFELTQNIVQLSRKQKPRTCTMLDKPILFIIILSFPSSLCKVPQIVT
jgi:hypothetical protein